MVAFQVPITFEGIPVTDADFVNRAHAQDYAVHVWLSNDREDEETYERLLAGTSTGSWPPSRAGSRASSARRASPGPTAAGSGPAVRTARTHSSIACRVKAVGIERVKRKVADHAAPFRRVRRSLRGRVG